MTDNRYDMRGVSATKEDVHAAIKNVDKGLFPGAFCKIIPDVMGGDPESSHRWLMLTGVRQAIWACGKGLRRMP